MKTIRVRLHAHTFTHFHTGASFLRRLKISEFPDALGKIAPNDTFELSA